MGVGELDRSGWEVMGVLLEKDPGMQLTVTRATSLQQCFLLGAKREAQPQLLC